MRSKFKNIMLLLFVCLFPNLVYAEEVKIGDNVYSSIKEAIEIASSGDEIILLSNIESKITVDESKKIVINLNNYSIYNQIVNNGDLTLIGSGSFLSTGTYITNNENATIIIDNISFVVNSSITKIINNLGKATMKNITLSIDEELNTSKYIVNSGDFVIESGTYNCPGDFINNSSSLTINSGTFNLSNVLYSIQNTGQLVINGGDFSVSNGTLIKNEKELIINNGTFTGTSVLANSNSNFLDKTDIVTTATINNGNFSTTDQILGNSVSSSNATITINGGLFESTTEEYVFGTSCYGDNCLINIFSSTVKALNSKGIFVTGDNKVVLGINDQEVVDNNPYIQIPSGSIGSTYVDVELNFFDGKVILNDYLLDNDNQKLYVPDNYYVKYDNNEDGTMTAFLVSYSNNNNGTNNSNNSNNNQDISSDNFGDDNLEDTSSSDSEGKNNDMEQITNPQTGDLIFKICALVLLVSLIMIAFGYYRYISKEVK